MNQFKLNKSRVNQIEKWLDGINFIYSEQDGSIIKKVLTRAIIAMSICENDIRILIEVLPRIIPIQRVEVCEVQPEYDEVWGEYLDCQRERRRREIERFHCELSNWIFVQDVSHRKNNNSFVMSLRAFHSRNKIQCIGIKM